MILLLQAVLQQLWELHARLGGPIRPGNHTEMLVCRHLLCATVEDARSLSHAYPRPPQPQNLQHLTATEFRKIIAAQAADESVTTTTQSPGTSITSLLLASTTPSPPPSCSLLRLPRRGGSTKPARTYVAYQVAADVRQRPSKSKQAKLRHETTAPAATKPAKRARPTPKLDPARHTPRRQGSPRPTSPEGKARKIVGTGQSSPAFKVCLYPRAHSRLFRVPPCTHPRVPTPHPTASAGIMAAAKKHETGFGLWKLAQPAGSPSPTKKQWHGLQPGERSIWIRKAAAANTELSIDWNVQSPGAVAAHLVVRAPRRFRVCGGGWGPWLTPLVRPWHGAGHWRRLRGVCSSQGTITITAYAPQASLRTSCLGGACTHTLPCIPTTDGIGGRRSVHFAGRGAPRMPAPAVFAQSARR